MDETLSSGCGTQASRVQPFTAQSPIHIQSTAQSHIPNGKDISFSFYVKPEQDDEPEISIFDARKYFCENNYAGVNPSDLVKNPLGPRLSTVSSDGYGRNFWTSSFCAASSEASWNSQTGLLVNPPVTVKPLSPDDGDRDNPRRKDPGKKWVFGRNCCCTCKKSVRVKEVAATAAVGPAGRENGARAKSDSRKGKAISGARVLSSAVEDFPSVDRPRLQRISASGMPFVDGSFGLLFPVLKNPTHAVRSAKEDPPRVSLEVFQPAENNPGSGGGRRLFIPGSPIARVVIPDDDLGSDASSDLFELESFSTQTRRRDSLDQPPILNSRWFASAVDGGQYDRRGLDEPPTPSVAATECYAPSEISINWSVTTATGYDRASVSNFSASVSEAGGAAFLRRMRREEACVGDGGGRKASGGILLLMSCRQGQAVSVGPQPVKCLPARAPVSGRPA